MFDRGFVYCRPVPYRQKQLYPKWYHLPTQIAGLYRTAKSSYIPSGIYIEPSQQFATINPVYPTVTFPLLPSARSNSGQSTQTKVTSDHGSFRRRDEDLDVSRIILEKFLQGRVFGHLNAFDQDLMSRL
jgi:hypothetical protein